MHLTHSCTRTYSLCADWFYRLCPLFCSMVTLLRRRRRRLFLLWLARPGWQSPPCLHEAIPTTLVCYESRPDSVSSFRPSRSVRPMGLPVLSMHVNNVVDNGDDGDEKCWQYYFNQRKSEPQDDSCITRQHCPVYGTEKVAQPRRLLYCTPQYE